MENSPKKITKITKIINGYKVSINVAGEITLEKDGQTTQTLSHMCNGLEATLRRAWFKTFWLTQEA